MIWTTWDEKRFLNGLGKHTGTELTRPELLERYIKASENRVEWDKIDKEEAFAHAQRLLRKEIRLSECR